MTLYINQLQQRTVANSMNNGRENRSMAAKKKASKKGGKKKH